MANITLEQWSDKVVLLIFPTILDFEHDATGS